MIVSRGGSVFNVDIKQGGFYCYLCGKLFHNNVVLPNGDVYLCCMDYALKHNIGNLFDTHFDSLDRARVVELSNQEGSDIICRQCEFWVYEDSI